MMTRTARLNRPAWWIVASLAGLVAFLVINAARVLRDPEEAEPLTVGQTVGLAFHQPVDSPTLHLFARANPGAREAMRRVIANEELREHHHRAWWILGRIGDASDVAEIDRAICSLTGLLDRPQRDALHAMVNALGVLCRREVDGACDLLVRMQDPSYWKGKTFRLSDRPSPQSPPQEYEMIIYSMQAYACSRRLDLGERVDRVLSSIGDPPLKAMMSTSLNVERLKEHGDDIATKERPAPSPDELKAIMRGFNGNLDDPRPTSHRGR